MKGLKLILFSLCLIMGIATAFSTCFQPNATTATSCGALGNGSYSTDANFGSSNTSYNYAYYQKNATMTNGTYYAVIGVITDGGPFGRKCWNGQTSHANCPQQPIIISASCWSASSSNLSFRIVSNPTESGYLETVDCYNGTSWVSIFSDNQGNNLLDGSAAGFRNESMYWNMTVSPNLTQPTISPASPNVTSILNCTNGTFSHIDGDTENTSARTWAWYLNGSTISNQTSQTLNLQAITIFKGDNVSCKESTSSINWSLTTQNTSNNTTMVNSAPTPLTPISLHTAENYLTINCTATDPDSGADVVFSNLTSTSGSITALTNGTSSNSFFKSFNITSLSSSTVVNATCFFNDSSGASANITGSFTTSIGNDSYSGETQTAYTTQNNPVNWALTYSTSSGNHTCNYIFLKTDVQPNYNQVLNSSGDSISLSTNNSTNIGFDCVNSGSPYTIKFSTSIVNSSSGSIVIAGLGSNAVRYNISLNKTLNVDFTMQASIPSSSTNRKLWECTSSSFSACVETDLSFWVAQAFIESGSYLLSKNYSLNSNETSFITSYDAVAPVTPGGGGGGTITIPSNTTIIVQAPTPGQVNFCSLPVWCDVDLFLKGKSFGLSNYWIWVSPLYLLFLLVSFSMGIKDKNLLLGGPANILLFMLWALGIIAYWPGGIL